MSHHKNMLTSCYYRLQMHTTKYTLLQLDFMSKCTALTILAQIYDHLPKGRVFNHKSLRKTRT